MRNSFFLPNTLSRTATRTASGLAVVVSCLVCPLAKGEAGVEESLKPVVISAPAVWAVYTDSGDGIHGGCVLKVNLLTGEKTILSRGGLLIMPLGVAVAPDGTIGVSDTGRLIAINPTHGEQRLLMDNSDGRLGMSGGIFFDRKGNLLIANFNRILRLNLKNGKLEVVSSGGFLQCPSAVVESESGELIVSNMGARAAVVGINPKNGKQRLISGAQMLRCPQSLAVRNGVAYVTDVATPNGNFGEGIVVAIDLFSGTQREVARGGYLVEPLGIAVDAEGTLIVSDPYTINESSTDLFDGAVIRILEGKQEIITRGSGDLVNSRGVAILPPDNQQNGRSGVK